MSRPIGKTRARCVYRKKRQRKIANTILTAAARLFREQGSGATGVDSITEDAGFTHGAVYSEFGSKKVIARRPSRSREIKTLLAATDRGYAERERVSRHRCAIPVARAPWLSRSGLRPCGSRQRNRPDSRVGFAMSSPGSSRTRSNSWLSLCARTTLHAATRTRSRHLFPSSAL